MAILSQLSLTEVSDLRAEADAFENHASELKTLTDSMFELIDGTASVWSGPHTDLVEIASNYEAAESDNDSITQSLTSDVDLV